MSRGLPSMTALLGLLAIAGYQNRDKIAEMLGAVAQDKPGASGQGGQNNSLATGQGGGLGGCLASLVSAAPVPAASSVEVSAN